MLVWQGIWPETWLSRDKQVVSGKLHWYSGTQRHWALSAETFQTSDLHRFLSLSYISGGYVYVSRSSGIDTASCGEFETTSCASLAVGIARAQPGSTIIVDGTGTKLDPYPCTSSSPKNTLNINVSVHFQSFKSVPYIRCKDGGTFFLDGTKNYPVGNPTMEVVFEGLVFVNSSIQAEDCRVQLANCVFTNASNVTAALSLSSKGDFPVSLDLQNLTCMKSSTSCILVRAHNVVVKVSDSVFAQNTVNSRDLGIFTILAPGEPGKVLPSNVYSFHVTFTRTTFRRNYSPHKGTLHMDFKNQEDSFCKNNQGETATFLHLVFNTSPLMVWLSIDAGTFHDNTGRGLGIVSGHKVNISLSDSVFIRNFHPRGNGAAIFLNGFTNATLTISKSNFTSNNCSGAGGAIAVIGTMSVLVQIQSSLFEQNVASFSGSAVLVGPSCVPHPLQEEVRYANVLIRNVQFTANVLLLNPYLNFYRGGTATFDVSELVKVNIQDSCFIENTAVKGSLTLYIQSGYDQHVWIYNTNFSRNRPSRNLMENSTEVQQVQGLVIASPEGLLDITLGNVVISHHYTADPSLEFVYLLGQSVMANFNSLVLANNTNGSINIIGKGSGEWNSSAMTGVVVEGLQFVNNANFAWLSKVSNNINCHMEFQNVNFSGNQNRQSSPLFQVEGESLGGTSVSIQNVFFDDNFVFAPVLKLQFDLDSPSFIPCNISPSLNQINVNIQGSTFTKNYMPSSNVVELKNGRYEISNCLFLDNFNSQRFSNVFLDQGSTTVEITNTRFLQVTKPRDVHGFQFGRNILLNSDTFATVALKNVTLKWDIPGATAVLFMVSRSFRVVKQATTIECPLGDRLARSNNSFYSSYVAKNCDISKMMLTYLLYACEKCPRQTYTILPNATCLPCPSGGNCTDNVAARAGFWGYPVISPGDPPGKVAFAQCPPGYCCPQQNISCPYRNETYLRTGCQGNREGFLCGKCRQGYTETLFSAECRKTQQCRDYWFWPVSLFISLGFALYLIKKPDLWLYLKRKMLWFKSATRSDGPEAATNRRSGGYMKVVFYFYQMAYLLMFYDEAMLNFLEMNVIVPVMGFFNFRISYNDRKPGFVCPLAGLSATSKTILYFFQVFVVFMCIATVYLAHAVLNKIKKKRPRFAPGGPYLGAVAEGLLLGYSTLAITIMKMLQCVELGSKHRSFYDGNVECYSHWWQRLSLALAIAFVFPFSLVIVWGTKLLLRGSVSAVQFLLACILPLPFLLYWLTRKLRALGGAVELSNDAEVERRGSVNLQSRGRPSLAADGASSCVLAVVCGPYCRPSSEGNGGGVIYWEGVLVFRRLILIMLLVSIPETLPRMMLMAVVCILALSHHVWVKPFADWKVNLLETASLTGLVFIALKSFAQASYLRSGTQLLPLENTTMKVFQWIEILLLGITPLLFLVVAGVALISQFFYWVVILAKSSHRCTRVLQGWEEI